MATRENVIKNLITHSRLSKIKIIVVLRQTQVAKKNEILGKLYPAGTARFICSLELVYNTLKQTETFS